LCGLALDYCVKFTAVDSKKYGFDTKIISDLTKSIGDFEEVKKQMT